jgi:hypothetical protein
MSHGDKSDLICIECAIDSVENPPSYVQDVQPVEFNEKFYVLRISNYKNRAALKLDFLKKHALKINTSAAHVFAR